MLGFFADVKCRDVHINKYHSKQSTAVVMQLNVLLLNDLSLALSLSPSHFMRDYTSDGAFGFWLITHGQSHLIEKFKLIFSKSSLKSLMLLLVA